MTTLLPTIADNSVKVVYNKLSGSVLMPSSITVYVEALPMVRGVCRKVVHVPIISLSGSLAEDTTIYAPAADTAVDMQPKFRYTQVPLYGSSFTTALGTIYMGTGNKNIYFAHSAGPSVIQDARLEIETLTY